MGRMDDAEQVHPEDVAQWRAWLEEHHATSDGVWLVAWRSHTGRPAVSYEDAVCEALCVGWIDAKTKVLDDERSMMWLSPRRPTSPWAGSNKRRVARLEAEGRMRPAGRRLVELARRNGMWTVLDDSEALIESAALRAALDAEPEARRHWDSFPPGVRRTALGWIALAKREETRQRRVASVVERAARGVRPV